MKQLKQILDEIADDLSAYHDGQCDYIQLIERIQASIISYEEMEDVTLEINDEDDYDAFPLVISSTTQPIAWKAWKNDLVKNNGWSEEQASKYMVNLMLNDGIEMELYYEENCGFGVEYEPNFKHDGEVWYCDHCGQPV